MYARTTGIRAALLTLVFVLPVGAARAVPLFTHDVFCATGIRCGAMEIDAYAAFTLDDVDAGGVLIDGQFAPSPGVGFSGLHYIQSINVDEDPLPYVDGTALPIPYIDTPPGGYQNQPFDYLVYYDEGEFPTFFDAPRSPLDTARTEPDNVVDLDFETWLVAVIDENLGANDMSAKDDSYKVAPLLGWTWGYDITFDPMAALFTVTRDPFNWLLAPSADWNTALGQTYGVAMERFNVTLGNCDVDACKIPEPAPTLLAITGLVLAFFGARIRRRNHPRAHGRD